MADFLCTMCGRESRENARRGQDITGSDTFDSRTEISATGGYGSSYLQDLTQYRIKLCESCFVAVLMRCQLPIEVTDVDFDGYARSPAVHMSGEALEEHVSDNEWAYIRPSLPEPPGSPLMSSLFEDEASRWGSAEDLFYVALEASKLVWGRTDWVERDLISSRLKTRMSRLREVLTEDRWNEIAPLWGRIASYYRMEASD